LKSFPPDRAVVVRADLHQEKYKSIKESVEPWLKDMNMKARFEHAFDGDRKIIVAVLKSAKKAAIFKLAWG
jgi:hypothetical protein